MGAKSEHFLGQIQQVAAGASAGAASVSWLSTANEVLQLIATLIAIVAGLVALYPVVKRLWISRRSSQS